METHGSQRRRLPAARPVRSRSLRERSASAGRARYRHPYPAMLWVLIAFFLIEYLRPPPLQPLHLPMLFVAVVLGLWVFSAQRPWAPVLTRQLVFLVTGAMVVFTASNNFKVYLQSRVTFGYLVASIAVIWFMGYRKQFKLAFWIWIAMMVFEAVYGIGNGGRGYGAYFGDENDLALAMTMAFPFALLGFRLLRGWKRWASAGVALVLTAGIVTSFSRGGFLGFVAAAGYCVFYGRHRLRNLALGVVGGLILFLAVPSNYKSEMQTIGNMTSGTAETRLFIWTSALRMWMDHPILGVGPGNAKYQTGKYQPGPMENGLFSAHEFQNRDWSGKAMHSVYIELIAERGILGVGIFLWLVVCYYRGMRRLRRRGRSLPPDLARDVELYGLGLEAAMAGFLVAGTFLSVLYYPYFWFFTALAAALERAVERDAPRRPAAAQTRTGGVRTASRPTPAPAAR